MGSRPLPPAYTELEVKVLGFIFIPAGILDHVWVRHICQDAAFSPDRDIRVDGSRRRQVLLPQPLLGPPLLCSSLQLADSRLRRRRSGLVLPVTRKRSRLNASSAGSFISA